jgi:hypothetical protein
MQRPFDRALESGRGGAATWDGITINGKAYGVDRGGQDGAQYVIENFVRYLIVIIKKI